jgi:hypothetical protein
VKVYAGREKGYDDGRVLSSESDIQFYHSPNNQQRVDNFRMQADIQRFKIELESEIIRKEEAKK